MLFSRIWGLLSALILWPPLLHLLSSCLSLHGGCWGQGLLGLKGLSSGGSLTGQIGTYIQVTPTSNVQLSWWGQQDQHVPMSWFSSQSPRVVWPKKWVDSPDSCCTHLMPFINSSVWGQAFDFFCQTKKCFDVWVCVLNYCGKVRKSFAWDLKNS